MLLFRCKPLLPASRECLSTSSIAQRFKTCKQTEYRLRALSFLPALCETGLPERDGCDDSYLDGSQGLAIDRDDVYAALNNASGGPVIEGCVGAGTGMQLFV